jgi:hypothetical protein
MFKNVKITIIILRHMGGSQVTCISFNRDKLICKGSYEVSLSLALPFSFSYFIESQFSHENICITKFNIVFFLYDNSFRE